MYCRECGAQINEKAVVCPHCGVRPLNSDRFCQHCGRPTKPEQEMCVVCGVRLRRTKNEEESLTLVKLASCCFPIVGAVLYFVWRTDKPESANTACKWALVGVLVVAIVYFVALCLGGFSYYI